MEYKLFMRQFNTRLVLREHSLPVLVQTLGVSTFILQSLQRLVSPGGLSDLYTHKQTQSGRSIVDLLTRMDEW